MDKKIKNQSIEYILSQGLVKPQTAREKIWEMINTIGFRFIFWDTGYSLFFTVLTLTIVFVLFNLVPDDYQYSAALALAPMFFLIISMFAETSERAYGLYELKQTCRYTIQQITALRMICYSVVGFVFTTFIATISTDNGYEFLLLLSLCLSALFFCVTLSILFMRFIHSKWANVVFSAIWVLVNLLVQFSLGERWEKLLEEVPIVFAVALAVLGGVSFVHQVSKMLLEVRKHAIA